MRALQAVLCGENPQHVLIYGPPGVGKTCAARLALEAAKRSEGTPFGADAPFVEMDATCLRFDERAIADPLFGSVHDPSIRGPARWGKSGVPQPKEGAVTRAHGGVLFLDEIGEMHPVQMNKLLKVLEDRVVRFDSAYYDPGDEATPAYIHDIFQHGLPADFRLIGATTRSPRRHPPGPALALYGDILPPAGARGTGAGRGKTLPAAPAAHCPGRMPCWPPATPTAPARRSTSCSWRRPRRGRKGAAASPARTWNTSPPVRAAHACASRDRRGEMLPGQVNALAVSGAEVGTILRAEAVARPGHGKLRVTGVVAQEEVSDGRGHRLRRSGTARDSAEAARTALSGMGVPVERYDIHVNFPGGAPSGRPLAGLAMAVAMRSAIAGEPVAPDAAMTGEISVTGAVLSVGGVRTKVRAAARAGLRRVLIPWDDRDEAGEGGIEVIPVRTLQEALELLRAPAAAHLPRRHPARRPLRLSREKRLTPRPGMCYTLTDRWFVRRGARWHATAIPRRPWERILAEAARLFLQKGYEKTSCRTSWRARGCPRAPFTITFLPRKTSFCASASAWARKTPPPCSACWTRPV